MSLFKLGWLDFSSLTISKCPQECRVDAGFCQGGNRIVEVEAEVLSAEIEWEAKRIAAAFGAESFTCLRGHATLIDFHASSEDLHLWRVLDSRREQTMLRVLDIKKGNQRCQVSVTNVLGSLTEEDKWVLIDQGVLREEMARWLYRLGFEDEGVLSKLPVLTMHEQMELRLSMPREFWPKKWREEESASG